MPEVADLIEEVGYQLSVEVEDRTRRELLKAYGRGADMLAYETTGKTGPVSLGGTVPRQVHHHIDEIVAPIADWNESLAKKIGDMVRQKAVREDLSPGEVAQFIRAELPRLLGSEKVTIQRPGKRPFTTTPDQYTEMIARTLPATLRNEAYLDEAAKAGIYESWTWVAMGDERMCDICGQRHGKTYGFDAPRPPGHPNCRCRALLNLAKDAEKPAGAPTPDQIAQVRARQDALDESYAAAVALSEERARLLEAAAGQPLKGDAAKKLHQLESAITKQRREAAKVQTEIYRIKANMPKTVPEKKVEATLRDRANNVPVALRGLGPTQATNAGAVVSSYAHDYPAFTRDAFGGITSATARGDGTFRTELRKEIEAEMSRRGADPDWSSYYAEKRSAELLEGLPGPEGEWRVRSVALGDGPWVMLGNDAELSSPALNSVLAQDVRDGRLQWGAESPIAMWEAEFGRAAVGHLGLTAPGSEIDTLYQSMSSAEIADAVGSAAAGDPDSFAAACWAEFRCSPDPRPASMAVGRHIEENLQLYEKGHKAPVETARSRLVPSGTPLKGEVPTPPTVPQETKERLLAAQYDIEDEVKKIQDWNHLASLIQIEGNLVSSQIQWYRDSQAAAKAAYPAAIRLRDEIVACKNQYKEAGLPLPSGLPFKDYAIQGIPIPSKLDIDALIAAAAAKIKKEWEYSQSQVKKDLDAVIEYNAKISGLMETAGVGELIEMAEKAATHLEDARNRRDSMEYDSADYQKLTGTPLALKIQDPNNVELRETVDSIKAHFKKGTPPGEKIDLEQLDRRVAEFNDTQKIMTSLIETANEFNAAVYDLLRNFKHNRDYLEYRFRTARNGLTAAVRHYGELTQIDAKIVELGGVSRIKEVPNPAKITLVLEEEDLARFFEAQADAEPVVAGADNEQAEMDYLARLEDYLRQRETVDRYNAEARAVLSDPSSNLNDLLVRWEEADRALRRARSLYVFLVDRREELDIAGTLPWDPFETRLSPGDYEIRSVWSDRQSGSSEPGPRIDPVIRRRFEHEIETIREGYETVDKFNAEIDSFIETGMGINDLKRLHAEVYSDWKEADYHREKAISIANEIVSFGWPSVHNEIPERNPGPKYTVAEIIEMVLDAQAATTMKGGARAWAATLTGEERSNISSYTATYYSTINRKCREGTWRGDPAIASIDSALSKGSLSEQTVYRGIRADPDRMHQYKAAVGTTVPERAYVSTSRSKDIASGFVGAEHGEAIIFEIRVPDGTPGAYIAPLSNLVEEDEVLLMRGGGIKIQSATEDANGALWVKCEFVPPDLRAGGAGAELASLRSDIIEAVRELKKYSDFAVNPPPEMLYRLNLGNLGAKTEEAMRTRSKAANLLIQHNDMVKNLKEAGIIVDPPPDGFPAFPQDIPTVFEVNWQVRCEERAHPLITTFEGELVQLKKAVEYVEEFNSSIRDHISVPFDLNEILYWRSAAADKISEANDLYSGLNDLSLQVMRISGQDLAMPTDPAKLQIEISEAEIRAAFDALSSPSKTPEASQKDWSEWAETLSEEELDAIRDYSADSYYDLNAWLRAGKDPAGTVFEDLVDRLDHVVESGVLRAQTVYRGIPANSNVIESYVRSVGVIVPDSGYMSTSCSNLDAELFTNEKGLILEIQVPDGAPGAAIGPLSVGDTEILMPRGTNLRILSADLVEGLWHVKSEVVI